MSENFIKTNLHLLSDNQKAEITKQILEEISEKEKGIEAKKTYIAVIVIKTRKKIKELHPRALARMSPEMLKKCGENYTKETYSSYGKIKFENKTHQEAWDIANRLNYKNEPERKESFYRLYDEDEFNEIDMNNLLINLNKADKESEKINYCR